MTTPALVKQSDLKRMATIAKREGVTVWIEIDGRKVGVSPAIPVNHNREEVEDDEEITL